MTISSYITILSFTFIPLSKSERFSELFGFSAGAVGLSLSTAQVMLGTLQWGIRQLSESENHLTSVERLLEYAKLEPEYSLVEGLNYKIIYHMIYMIPLYGEIFRKEIYIMNSNASNR